MFEKEYAEYRDNKENVLQLLANECGIDPKDALILIFDYLATVDGYNNIKNDIQQKLEGDE